MNLIDKPRENGNW